MTTHSPISFRYFFFALCCEWRPSAAGVDTMQRQRVDGVVSPSVTQLLHYPGFLRQIESRREEQREATFGCTLPIVTHSHLAGTDGTKNGAER